MRVHVITATRHGSTEGVGQAVTARDADGAAHAIAPGDVVQLGAGAPLLSTGVTTGV